MSAKVLVIGGGSREHALVWKLSQSDQVENIFVCPGNAGTEKVNKTTNVDLLLIDHEVITDWCLMQKIDLVVVGPEAPLAEGIADVLHSKGLMCFGPSKKAAMIESSKLFSKQFMDQYSIPTARWKTFTDIDKAIDFINTCDFNGIVVKASGLAAGKGVVVTASKDEAIEAVLEMIEMRKFGDAGSTIILEEKIEGDEISVFSFCDGTTYASFPPAQDYKRAFNDDKGPNTGGMGAYCPVTSVSKQTLEYINREIVKKTIFGMKKNGYPFVGLLYTGLMLTKDGPKVLEYNCRFGDPETQVVLPLLTSDLYQTMRACCTGSLTQNSPTFSVDQCAVSVVIASGGYPLSYRKGLVISGLETVKNLSNLVVFHAGTKKSDNDIQSNGGRVLSVTSFGHSMKDIRKQCYEAVAKISFADSFYRNDIALKVTGTEPTLSYLDSGVDINAGNALVEAIKPLACATTRPGCMTGLGGFGALFDLKAAGYQDPILVSGTDGVGTKLKIASECSDHSTIGIDLVAMCVNDILAQGAEPLFFLDYYACGKLDKTTAEQVIAGIAEGCEQAGCALIGGETAEMPGMYQNGTYDLAGFAVGAVERNHIIPNHPSIQAGDIVIGIASSGVHSNGFSLVRKIVEKSGMQYSDDCPFSTSKSTLGQTLLTPTKIYVKSILPLLKDRCIKGLAHITGGGLTENIPRILPSTLSCILDAHSWDVPTIFGWLASVGNISADEMLRTFNCGIGAAIIVENKDAKRIIDRLNNAGEKAFSIGILRNAELDQPRVNVKGFDVSLDMSTKGIRSIQPLAKKMKKDRMKVGVLISGSGTNLQALIDHSMKPESSAEIVIVISNIENAYGLQRAKQVGIPTKVITHKHKKRLDFDMEVLAALNESHVEMVCLAGFMRVLTGEFVRNWPGRLINIHPSLLPSFKGIDAHAQALKAGVRISGCTAHFVVEEVDAGGIIVQESVPVLPNDTVETLQERVKLKEWEVFPKAMEFISSGKV